MIYSTDKISEVSDWFSFSFTLRSRCEGAPVQKERAATKENL
jgi:hypothetical protein